MTMQKVAWPTTIVKQPEREADLRNVVERAMPVTMPGSAIGRTTTNEIDSRPKKRWRETAIDASVPEHQRDERSPLSAAAIEVMNACCRPLLRIASAHQSSVKPTGGQAGVVPELKE